MDTVPRALRWVLVLWVTVGLAVSVRTLLKPESHTVFPVFATGSLHWWADEPVYADHAPLDYFRYPPFFAVALTPLALVGMTAGGILWSWLSLAIYGWGCWRFLREVLPWRWSANREALFLALALFAGLRGIWNAQSNALVCGLLLLGCADAVGSRWWRSALWLSLSVLVKLTPLAVVLLLVVVEPRRLGPRVLVLLVLGLLLPFLTRPPAVVMEQHAGWVRQMRQTANERWPGFRDAWLVWNLATNPPDGEDLKGYLMTPLTPEQAFAYRTVQLVTALGAFLWVLWLRRRGTPRWLHLTLALGVGTGWLLLVGPSVEHPTFVLLAPTLLWALLQSRHRLIGLAAFLILVLGWGALTDRHAALSPWVLLPLPLGTTLYLIWLLWSGPNQSGILPPSRDPATLESTPCDTQPG